MRNLFCIIALALLTPNASAYNGFQDDEIGSGFVSVEGGLFTILGNGRTKLNDAPMFDLNFGISLTKEFKSETDYEPLKVGPKIGFGIGQTKGSNEVSAFYDILLKIRYSFGTRAVKVRPFIDLGPGLFTYEENAFQVEGGIGLEYLIGRSFTGINVQYKEIFGSSFLNRGVQFMGALGYQF